NMKSQAKLHTPDQAPLSLPLLRPRKPVHPPYLLLASLTSICPLSSLVITCSKDRGSASSTLPVSSNWLKSCCSVCSTPLASRPRNLCAYEVATSTKLNSGASPVETPARMPTAR